MWQVWNEVHDQLLAKPVDHFRRSVEIQFDEIEEHLAAGDREAAAREAVDIVGIGLNCLRWLGYGPAEIAEIAESRTESRMRGRTQEILDKYERLHGI
jgi:hypothetical protein